MDSNIISNWRCFCPFYLCFDKHSNKLKFDMGECRREKREREREREKCCYFCAALVMGLPTFCEQIPLPHGNTETRGKFSKRPDAKYLWNGHFLTINFRSTYCSQLCHIFRLLLFSIGKWVPSRPTTNWLAAKSFFLFCSVIRPPTKGIFEDRNQFSDSWHRIKWE